MQGISQVELAGRIGKSPTWVCLVLNGHEPAPENFKIAVAAVLGLPQDQCFREDAVTAAARAS